MAKARRQTSHAGRYLRELEPDDTVGTRSARPSQETCSRRARDSDVIRPEEHDLRGEDCLLRTGARNK
jgi:hypothetical protein